MLIILQFVQALKYETDPESRLFKFLVEISMKSKQLAILVYWYLKTECEHLPSKKEQKGMKDQSQALASLYQNFFHRYLEEVKKDSKELFQIIEKQNNFIKYLRKLSKIVKDIKEKGERKQEMRKQLESYNWESLHPLIYPLDTTISLKHPIPSECNIFSSAKMPMKLTFETMDGGKFSFIYKNGDDLRQDQLIL